jgi:hypothetical protein
VPDPGASDIDGRAGIDALGLGACALGLGGMDATTAEDADGDDVPGAGLAGEPQPATIETTTIADASRFNEIFIGRVLGRYDRKTFALAVCDDVDVSACRQPGLRAGQLPDRDPVDVIHGLEQRAR